MKLWFYNDATGWGDKLHRIAKGRGHQSKLFRTADQVDGGDAAFSRLHLDPLTREADKAAIYQLRGVLPTIPTARAARLYDDKLAQAAELTRWMPETLVATCPGQAGQAARQLGLPLMSKTAEGASSHNVRFIQTETELQAEIAAAFGVGIPCQYRQRQIGYVLFQRFLAGNANDFRVIAVGRERLILRRGNRDDRPMASGGNKEMPVTFPDPEAEDVLAYANRFFAEERFRFCGVDVVRDHDAGEWRILECTTSWPTKNNAAHRTVSGRNWGEFFDIIVDEIEADGFAC